MVERLHGYLPVGQQHGLTIHKCLVRHMVVLVVAVDIMHTAILVKQHYRYTVAGSHPDVVVAVFYYRVYNIVVQAILGGVNLWQQVAFAAIHLQALRCAHPCPATRILKHAVHGAVAEFWPLVYVTHHRAQLVSYRGAPSISMEWLFVRHRVKYAAILGTGPHTTLTVEGNHVDIGFERL